MKAYQVYVNIPKKDGIKNLVLDKTFLNREKAIKYAKESNSAIIELTKGFTFRIENDLFCNRSDRIANIFVIREINIIQ